MAVHSSTVENQRKAAPGGLVGGLGLDAVPPLEGVPTEPRPLMTADGHAPAAELDLNLDIDFATAAMDTQPIVVLAPPDGTDALAHATPSAMPAVAFEPSPPRALPTQHLPAAPDRGFCVDAGQVMLGTSGFPWQDRRVLVVSADAQERVYLRARLALAKLVWVDEMVTTTQAESAMDTHHYLMAIFNLDIPVVDGTALAKRFRRVQPEAVCVVTGVPLPVVGPLGLLGRWRQWQREKELQGTGVEWLRKPFLPRKVALLFASVYDLGRNKNNS